MTSSERLLPLLPLLIPFAGAALAWTLPSGRVTSACRRWVYALALTAACAALIATREPDVIVRLRPLPGAALSDQVIAFYYDSTSFSLALLLLGAFALSGISALKRPMTRSEATSSLVLVGASVAACHAANLLTLSLSWGLMDLALLGLEFIRSREERIRHATWRTAVNLVSTLLLVAAAVLAPSELEQAQIPRLADAGLLRGPLMLAAILRLGAYPLPGSANRRWQTYVTSLCSGGCLWLRMAGVSPPAPALASWLVPGAGVALLATGVLAGLAPDLAAALPYMLLRGLSVLVAAPLLDATAGATVGFMTVANLAMCLALLRIDAEVRPMLPLRRWTRLPLSFALASLAGWPLTLGFVSDWVFLKLCLQTGSVGVFVLGSLASLLTSIPVWHRIRDVRREIVRKDTPRWAFWVPAGSAFAMVAVLASIGFHPPLLVHVWPGGRSGAFPPLAQLFTGDARMLVPLLSSGTLVPIGSYFLAKMQAKARERPPRGRAVGVVLELDWLYLAMEKALSLLQSLCQRALEMMEEPFSLVWSLGWGLAIAFYLMGR